MLGTPSGDVDLRNMLLCREASTANLKYSPFHDKAFVKAIKYAQSNECIYYQSIERNLNYRFVKGNSRAPEGSYCANVVPLPDVPPEEFKEWRSKVAMNITGLMKVPEIAGPIQELGAALGRRVVDADLYVAPPGCGSYGWHTDTVDVLVYLLLGSKRFRVAGRRPQSEVLVDASMSPGASVYIPAGAFHHGCGADGAGENSVLLSMAFTSSENEEELNREADQMQTKYEYTDFFTGEPISQIKR